LSGRNQGGRKLEAAKKPGGWRNILTRKPEEVSFRQQPVGS
jgi:hypothetical protein